jgi:hypothetical protein
VYIVYYLISKSYTYISEFIKKIIPKLSGFRQYKPEFLVEDQEQTEKIAETVRVLEETQRDMVNESREEKIQRILKHFDIYYSGIPDKYDKNGNITPGYPPNPRKATDLAGYLIRLNYYPAYLLLAKIYHFGMHQFDPQTEKAVKIYEFIMTNQEQFPLQIRIEAAELYNRIYPRRIQENIENIITNERPQIAPNRRVRQFENNIMDDIRNYELEPREERETPIRNDLQNVHDHAVVNTVSDIFNRIKTPNGKTFEEAEEEFTGILGRKHANQLKANAIDVLRKIKSEKELRDNFKDMWSYISAHQNKENLQDSLINTLSSGVEYGAVVCSTGIKSRIADCLSGIDENISIKPTWAIKEEMFGKAAKIRDDEYNSLSLVEKQYVDDPTPNNFQIDFYKELKGKVDSEMKKEYLNPGLLTGPDFEKHMVDVLAGFD